MTIHPEHHRPLPLRLIFPLLFVAVYLSHLTLLRLPYYWDEAGYYIPAAYDFFRTGSLIPFSTLANAHPPLPSLYLALWWKSSYTPAVTRTAMCFITAIALLGVYRLGMLLNGRQRVAATTTLLTAIYPIWFAQSTLAHADMFAAAATLWGLVFVFAAQRVPRAFWAAVACFTVAAWCKETAIITPVAIALWEAYRAQRSPGDARGHIRNALALLLPPVTLAFWYAYFHHRTGFFFGNPEFLRYNATSTLSPLRILLAFAHRILQLTAHMNMFVPVLCMLGAMLLLPLREGDGGLRPKIQPPDQAILYVVMLANLLFYSVHGRRAAHPLPAPALPTHDFVVRFYVLPAGGVLVGTGRAQCGRLSARLVRESSVQVRSGRQPELRRRHSPPPTGDS